AQVQVNLDPILADPMALLFLIIGLGYFIGKLKIKGFELGPSVGVLFIALYFGHKGYSLDPILGTLGFIFFIYSVGFQSGPRFFPAFKENGLRFVALGTFMIAVAAVAAALMSWIFGLSRGHLIGVMGGSLTTVSGVAAANRLLASPGAVAVDPAMAEKLIRDSTLAFAVTSVFGLVGLLAIIQALPRILGLDLRSEAQKLEQARKGRRDGRIDIDDDLRLGPKGPPQRRTYKVTNIAATGKTLEELRFVALTGCVLVKLHRGTELLDPARDTRLELDDKVMALGYLDAHEKTRKFLGEETDDEELLEVRIETASVVVTDPRVIGRSIYDLGITSKFACMIFSLRREGVEMPLTLDLKLEKGDQVIIAGPKTQLDELIPTIGRPESSIHETDLLTFAFGIFAGLLLGMVEVRTQTTQAAGFPILGTSGGLLLMGLLVGYLRYQHPVFGRVPAAARFLLLELGLLLFMAELGTSAGKTIVPGLKDAGVGIFVSGVVVTLAPVFAGYAFGRTVLGFDPVTLMGAITGGMINTPALGIVNRQAGSNLPAVGYAGVYAFATILLTVSAPIILRF
ncbi:MAG TPA: TrkA C-terminal domain-containing protein, partial [Planctomycetota bacterium]|nr:TrkA C-terminal domain-containing protein [Planctomycetota bacterium]